MGYTLGNKCTKNLCKRTVLVQFIIENMVTCFFLRHSVVYVIDYLCVSNFFRSLLLQFSQILAKLGTHDVNMNKTMEKIFAVLILRCFDQFFKISNLYLVSETAAVEQSRPTSLPPVLLLIAQKNLKMKLTDTVVENTLLLYGLLVYEKETLRGFTEPDTGTPTDDLEFEEVLNP